MKPTKRCDLCNKPIWDYDYVSIHDNYMEHDTHVHSCCYQQDKQRPAGSAEPLADMILRLAKKNSLG